MDELIKDFKNGMSIKNCSEKYVLSLKCIRKILKDNNIDVYRKKIIDIDLLKNYFKNNSLKECGIYFSVSEMTIKRILKANNIDSSIHNHSKIAIDSHKIHIEKKFKFINKLNKDYLYKEYVINNKDTKTIAEELNCNYSTIRKYIQFYKIKKDINAFVDSWKVRNFLKTGYYHPSQRPEVLCKMFKAKSRFSYVAKSENKYLFKSLHELCFALLLDNNNNIELWDYELITVPYIDREGKRRTYFIDFSVHYKDGSTKWFEVKPKDGMIPDNKRLYAVFAAKNVDAIFDGISDNDRNDGYKLFLDGYRYDCINFNNYANLKLDRKYTYYFKDTEDSKNINHDHYTQIKQVGRYYKILFTPKQKNKIKVSTV